MPDMQGPLTDAQRTELLKMAGLTNEQAGAFNTPAPVAAAVLDSPPTVEHTPAEYQGDTVVLYDQLAQQFLAKAKGNADTAKQLSENWAKAEFDKVKLSKVQAAALGVDKSAHNKAEYARIQRMREHVNSAMRKQSRGHVATKIASKKTAANNPELDAFVLANQGNPLVEQMVKLLNQ